MGAYNWPTCLKVFLSARFGKEFRSPLLSNQICWDNPVVGIAGDLVGPRDADG